MASSSKTHVIDNESIPKNKFLFAPLKIVGSKLIRYVVEKLYLCPLSERKVRFDYTSYVSTDKTLSKGAKRNLFLGIDSLSMTCVLEEEAIDYVLGRKNPSRNIFCAVPDDFDMEVSLEKVLTHIQKELCEYTSLSLNRKIYECSVRILLGVPSRFRHTLKEIIKDGDGQNINSILSQYLSKLTDKWLRAKIYRMSNSIK